MSDEERRATYAAEDRVERWAGTVGPVRVFASTWDPERIARFADVAAVQSYVDRVLALLRHRGEHATRAAVPVRVRARRGDRRAHYEPGGAVIAVYAADGAAGWAMSELTVLHELAHHLAGRPHSAAFRAAYVHLLEVTDHPVLAHLARLAYLDEGLRLA